MVINTKIRYGLRALIEIAISESPVGIYQKDIAAVQNISNKYLDPIVSALKVKGLIVNVGGKRSGYILGKPAEEITLLDIYTAFEPIIIVPCLGNTTCCDKSNKCKARLYWDNFKSEFEQILIKRTLANIISEKAYVE